MPILHASLCALIVMASIASVYLCYYTADAVFATSGVISVVTMGVITKFYSSSLFNDTDMMEKFWVLVEHMLVSCPHRV